MPIQPDQLAIVDEFSAALTGIIFEQEQIRVLLIPDEFSIDEPITNDDELKVAQAQMSCDIDSMRKLRKYRDGEAGSQRENYTRRLKLHAERILNYLSKTD
jgi:hypothetical protein